MLISLSDGRIKRESNILLQCNASESLPLPVDNEVRVKKAMPSSRLLSAYYLKKPVVFKGTPKRLPSQIIRNGHDALKQWELLRFAKYSDATDDLIKPANKQIRIENYRFLDDVKTAVDKKVFVEGFKDFTGFPDLRETSIRILAEFKRATNHAADTLNRKTLGDNPASILLAGHDEVCSVGLRRALPGSDLDNSFVLIKGGADYKSDKELVEEFKGELWDGIDQRLLSVNHMDSFPNVYTVREAFTNIDDFDRAYPPVDQSTKEHYFELRRWATDPIRGAEYNIALAKALPDKDKERAKNFAYFMQSVRDGEKTQTHKDFYERILWKKMESSQFCWCTNVAQTRAHSFQNEWMCEMKDKLLQREALQENFDSFDVHKQYDIVKNIIKASSGDHDGAYSEFLGSHSPLRTAPMTEEQGLLSAVKDANQGKMNHSARRIMINDILTGKINYEDAWAFEDFSLRKK